MSVFSALRDSQYFGSLTDVARFDPKYGPIAPRARGSGLHGRDVNLGLPQLADYVSDSAHPILALNQKSSLWPNQLDPFFLRCRNEGIPVGRHED